MPSVKIGEKHQITIPLDIFTKLHLKAGDVLNISLKDNTVVLAPSRIIPKDDSWFHSRKWQEKEAQADENIAQGKVSRVYTDVEEMLKDLDA